MLMAAMRLAAATTLASAGNQENARRRLKHYQALFAGHIPAGAAMFRDEETWTEIAAAMEIASFFEVTWMPRSRHYAMTRRAIVRVGDREWTTRYDLDVTPEMGRNLARSLDQMAPTGCEMRILDPEDLEA